MTSPCELVTAEATPSTPDWGAAAAAQRGFLTSIRQLPLVPALAVRLVRSLRDPSLGHAELAGQIAADPALAGQLLRLVNSPFYGMRRRIGTVADAIAMLGLNLVRRIVTATVVLGPQRALLPDTDATRGFWRHQLLVAALARELHAQRDDGAEDAEQAYMAGLLHDVGRLALHAWRPRDDAALHPSHTTGESALVADERARCGIDHALAGALLLHAWELPPAIVDAVGLHAQPTAPDQPLAATVWQANRLAHDLEAEPTTGAEAPWMLDSGLTPAHCRRLLEEVATMTAGQA